MLRHANHKILTPTGDKPHATHLRTALKHYVGLHAILFDTAPPSAAKPGHLDTWLKRRAR